MRLPLLGMILILAVEDPNVLPLKCASAVRGVDACEPSCAPAPVAKTPAPAPVAKAPAPAPPRPAGDQPPHKPPQLPDASSPDTITSGSRTLMASLHGERLFALGGIGVAGSTSPGEQVTRALAERPDAVNAFIWLARHGMPVARLYAYWALRTLAPGRARQFAAALEADPTSIVTISGCIFGTSSVDRIARYVARPEFAMPRP